eukprot:11203369-Lingulodinium_polyedra.AAC.1
MDRAQKACLAISCATALAISAADAREPIHFPDPTRLPEPLVLIVLVVLCAITNSTDSTT